jgi:hypothetical protein
MGPLSEGPIKYETRRVICRVVTIDCPHKFWNYAAFCFRNSWYFAIFEA